MSPRFYQSDETKGAGDGLYEFRPRLMQSQPYSVYRQIEMTQGKYSGQFEITYEDNDSQAILTSNAKLTAIIELSDLSDFLRF